MMVIRKICMQRNTGIDGVFIMADDIILVVCGETDDIALEDTM